VPFPYGWGTSRDDFTAADLAEPKRLVGELAARGVPMINITAANPYYNPHYSRPYSKSRESGLPPEHPIIGVARLIALAGEIQKTFPPASAAGEADGQVAIVGTGYSWLRGLMPNVMAWAKRSGLTTLAGAGRMAIAYPDFPADVLARGRIDERKVCLACGACTTIMRDGGTTGCVVRDGEVYGPIYRSGRARNEKPPA
jgi:2,4-dienoyl-CoA reductase-like NADH-dependent reductase (Old Yellow Enzyme family)